VLNGLFGIAPDGRGHIAFALDEATGLWRFVATETTREAQ
jgi:hypothetical protein